MTQSGDETTSFGGLTRRNVEAATSELKSLQREIQVHRREAIARSVFIALYVFAATVCQLACGALIVYLTSAA